MNNIIKTLILLNIILTSSANAALQPVETMYSEKGYPYKLLIERADSVNIIYTENKENQIQCSVKLEFNQKQWDSSTVSVSKSKFDDAPLASCLARDNAKEWLAHIFN